MHKRLANFFRVPFESYFQWKWVAAVVVGLIILGGIALRFYNLDYPAKEVFDEVYFPKFAGQYLRGIDVYDVHPPLGKFIIAIGLILFGDTHFGWRIIPFIFGVIVIFLMGRIAWKVTGSRVAGVLATLFVAIDGMFIAYSRTGLMDGILMVAIFSALYAAMVLKPKSSAILAGILLGVAVAIKWPAVAVFFPMLWYAGKVGRVKELLWSLPWAIAVYFLAVYTGEVLDGSKAPFADVIAWNTSAFNYHADIVATHPWGSPWWSWPIPLKPVLFLYDTLPNGTVQLMNTLGNPFVWISSSLAVAGTLVAGVVHVVKCRWKAFEHPLTPLVMGYFAFWLPWALVDRVVFLYHYFPSYGFALLILCYWLAQLWKVRRLLVMAYCLVALAVSLYYLPWAVGWIPVSLERIKTMLILQSWLY